MNNTIDQKNVISVLFGFLFIEEGRFAFAER